MAYSLVPLDQLTEQLQRLPTIGYKTAQRIAYHLLQVSEGEASALTSAITDARARIRECRVCCNLADGELCPVCHSDDRDRHIVCVVEHPSDVAALERTREYRGLYHVLHGCLSPMDGIGPEQLRIKQLLHRVAEENITEVIMATNPTAEGETTAAYIARLLQPFGIAVTRLAYGIPVGGDLAYADEVTLRRSLEGRNKL